MALGLGGVGFGQIDEDASRGAEEIGSPVVVDDVTGIVVEAGGICERSFVDVFDVLAQAGLRSSIGFRIASKISRATNARSGAQRA